MGLGAVREKLLACSSPHAMLEELSKEGEATKLKTNGAHLGIVDVGANPMQLKWRHKLPKRYAIGLRTGHQSHLTR